MDTNCDSKIGSNSKVGRRGHCTGHTLRRRHEANYRDQFSIHKIIRSPHPRNLSKDEIGAISEEFANYVDDGGLQESHTWMHRAEDSSWNAWSGMGMMSGNDIHYSLNKRKRWLLAEKLRHNICAANKLDNLDFKTVLVERDLIVYDGCPRRTARPDCVRVCESHTDHPEVLPNQKYALASQLRLKSKGLIDVPRRRDSPPWEGHTPDPDPEPEIYYEICHPRPDANSQWIKRSTSLSWKKSIDETKPASKQKHQKVKNYQYWHGLYDSHSLKQDIQECSWDEEELDVENEEHDGQAIPRTSPSLGMVVAHLLKRSDQKCKKRKKCKKAASDANDSYVNSNTNSASSSPVKMFGKKATIYEEASDRGDNDTAGEELARDNTATVPMEVSSFEELDVKPATVLRLAACTIQPTHLKNTFGCSYIESMSQPRRFAIDVSQRLSAASSQKVYALFEVIDDHNRNSVCNNWYVNTNQQMHDVEEFVNVRMTLIANPHFVIISESDLSVALYAGNGLVYTMTDVVQCLTNMVNDMTTKNNDDITSAMEKTNKYQVSMETVTKANGWQLRVDSPDGVFREIQEEYQETDVCECEHDTNTEYNPYCGICYDILQPTCTSVGDGAAAMKACGHWFCNECWTQHLRSRVKQGDFNIICPAYDCKSAADIVTKMSFMSTSDFFRHLGHVKDAAIHRKTEWQWCPNPKCGRMACVVAGTGTVNVNCQCGWLWCSLCLQDAHWPATCKQAAGYRERVKHIIPKMKNRAPLIQSVEVKRCPKCKYPIEKNGGCPHMGCRMCGVSFCWECLGEWSVHTWAGIHLKCPKSKITTQTVWLDNDNNSKYTLSELAMHHRELRTKSAMKRYEDNVHRLTSREFVKESSAIGPSSSLNSMIWDDRGEDLPVTWASTSQSRASLLERSSQRQEYVKFCFEAHFVLEFMAVYMSDRSLTRKHRKLFTIVTDRLEFITGRLDEFLGTKSNFGQARLLTHAGKMCIQQLAYQMKKQGIAQESN